MRVTAAVPAMLRTIASSMGRTRGGRSRCPPPRGAPAGGSAVHAVLDAGEPGEVPGLLLRVFARGLRAVAGDGVHLGRPGQRGDRRRDAAVPDAGLGEHAQAGEVQPVPLDGAPDQAQQRGAREALVAGVAGIGDVSSSVRPDFSTRWRSARVGAPPGLIYTGSPRQYRKDRARARLASSHSRTRSRRRARLRAGGRRGRRVRAGGCGGPRRRADRRLLAAHDSPMTGTGATFVAEGTRTASTPPSWSPSPAPRRASAAFCTRRTATSARTTPSTGSSAPRGRRATSPRGTRPSPASPRASPGRCTTAPASLRCTRSLPGIVPTAPATGWPTSRRS